MHHVLLIRALADALPLAESLKSKGIVPHLYPLFNPCFFPLPALKTPQAFIITSKNALRAIEGYEDLKKVPLYAVGDQTAKLAQTMGFANVFSASGTSQELLQLILQKATPQAGILWYLSGRVVKDNLMEPLKAAGFNTQRRIVYDMQAVEDLPPPLLVELERQKMSHIMFFSPHTTTIFVNLLKKRGLEKLMGHMTALCLSHAIAEKALILTWGKIWISPKPTAQSLIGYFDEKR
jgi:uroporphyrinogen-III synthase